MAAGLLRPQAARLCFCFWAVAVLSLAGSSAAASGTSAGAGAVGEAVVVDARSAVAETDSAFVCATLDWWPPEKCDYGTCAWGRAGLLNLVILTSLAHPLFLSPVSPSLLLRFSNNLFLETFENLCKNLKSCCLNSA